MVCKRGGKLAAEIEGAGVSGAGVEEGAGTVERAVATAVSVAVVSASTGTGTGTETVVVALALGVEGLEGAGAGADFVERKVRPGSVSAAVVLGWC